MGRKLAGIVVIAVLALALLAGCNVVGGDTNAIIGSIFIYPDDLLAPEDSEIWGGAEYHVMVYDESETVDPFDSSTVNTLTTVARLDSTFPGSAGYWYRTTNYFISDLPDGQYYVFVWIDVDDSGDFDIGSDAYGFYDTMGTFSGYAVLDEPYSPNVVVPETGIIDIDVWCQYPPPPEV
jgi:hypothetical protein